MQTILDEKKILSKNFSQFFCSLSKLYFIQDQFFSSGTDEVRAKREPSLCNESVKRHFWFFSPTAATFTRFASALCKEPLLG